MRYMSVPRSFSRAVKGTRWDAERDDSPEGRRLESIGERCAIPSVGSRGRPLEGGITQPAVVYLYVGEMRVPRNFPKKAVRIGEVP